VDLFPEETEFSLDLPTAMPNAAARGAMAELASRELCRRHLLPFVQRFNPNYQAGWVHKQICEVLEQFSQDVADKKSPRLMICVPPRHGKLLADNTPVLTTTGWKNHGDLEVGDMVFHPHGHPVKVLATSAKAPANMRVEFSDGSVIHCHENHEWTVYHRSAQQWITAETAYFTRTTKYRKQLDLTPGGRCMYQLQQVSSLKFPAQEFTMPPYVLGAWLGDGTSKKPAITHCTGDKAVVRAIEALGYPISSQQIHKGTGVVTTSFAGPKPNNSGRMWVELKALGVAGNKHIPTEYKLGSVIQRLALIAGLVDTDGHVCKKTGRVRIVAANKRLVDDIVEVLTGLGFAPHVSAAAPTTSTSGVVGKKTCYYIGFQPTLPLPTVLPRKQITRFAKQRMRGIIGITYAPQGLQGKCIQVDSEDGLYLAGKTLIPTHNSEIASRRFPAWHLGKYPQHEVIAASHTTGLAMGFSRRNRALLRDSDYHQIFDTRLDPDSQAAEEWFTAQGGAYFAAGVGSGIAGRGAHILMIDDPVRSQEDADSPTQREAAWDWYTSDAYTRLAPGGGVILIMTRWHEDDLGGRLLAEQKNGGDKWQLIEFPALATQDEPNRKKGEALHPDRYDEKSLARIRKVLGERKWSALFQQNPTPETGMYFTREMFKFYDPDVVDTSKLIGYQAWDLAVTTNDLSNYTVGMTAGVDEHDDIYILDRVRGKFDAMETMENICDAFMKWRPIMDIVGIEAGQIEKSIGPFMQKSIDKKRLYDMHILQLPPGRQDKAARARPIQGLMRQGRVLLPHPDKAPWVHELMDEMLRFLAGGTNDDQVDAMAWLGQMIMDMVGYRERPQKAKASWRDKLFVIEGGKTAMSA